MSADFVSTSQLQIVGGAAAIGDAARYIWCSGFRWCPH